MQPLTPAEHDDLCAAWREYARLQDAHLDNPTDERTASAYADAAIGIFTLAGKYGWRVLRAIADEVESEPSGPFAPRHDGPPSVFRSV